MNGSYGTRMTYRNHLIISAILMLMLVAGYRSYNGSIVTISNDRSEIISQDADYFLINALIKEYDTYGVLQYQLRSNSITHYLHNDNTLLQQPVLTNFSDNGQVTTSKSEHGKLLPGGKVTELWDNVVVIQIISSINQQPNEQKVRVDTDFITVSPDEEIADTDRPVLITSEASQTRAVGMTAWYKQGKLRLKSKVRGVYEPE